MRILKYRLIKNKKIVGYEEHRLLDDGLGNLNVFIYHSRTQHPMSWREIVSCPKEYLAHDDKDQYMEIADMNGGEIYENDIVEYANGKRKAMKWNTRLVCRNGNKREVVEFDCGIAKSPDYRLCTENEIRVIGNKRENPELLKDNNV